RTVPLRRAGFSQPGAMDGSATSERPGRDVGRGRGLRLPRRRQATGSPARASDRPGVALPSRDGATTALGAISSTEPTVRHAVREAALRGARGATFGPPDP